MKREEDVEEYLRKKKNKEDLTNIFKIGIALAGIIICLICGILTFIYRLQNPHLTETELMIYAVSKYWWADLWCIVGYFYLHNTN